jgi:hypothetical protein
LCMHNKSIAKDFSGVLCNVVVGADLIFRIGPHAFVVRQMDPYRAMLRMFFGTLCASASHLTYALARLSPSRYSPFPRLLHSTNRPVGTTATPLDSLPGTLESCAAPARSSSPTYNRKNTHPIERQSPAYTQVPCMQQISPHDRPVTHRTLPLKRSLQPELSSTTVRYLKIANSSKSARCIEGKGNGRLCAVRWDPDRRNDNDIPGRHRQQHV